MMSKKAIQDLADNLSRVYSEQEIITIVATLMSKPSSDQSDDIGYLEYRLFTNLNDEAQMHLEAHIEQHNLPRPN